MGVFQKERIHFREKFALCLLLLFKAGKMTLNIQQNVVLILIHSPGGVNDRAPDPFVLESVFAVQVL